MTGWWFGRRGSEVRLTVRRDTCTALRRLHFEVVAGALDLYVSARRKMKQGLARLKTRIPAEIPLKSSLSRRL